MNVVRTDTANDTKLVIEGALDALTAPEIRPVFDKVVTDGRKRVTVDIAAVTMIDSSGVGAIVSLFKRIKAEGGQVQVVGAKDQPLAVLKLLKLDRVFGL
ncbi:MAG: STAS domain-containing protein [Deltaproteobacteria bacterium]|nr:STAS domain-containing protein [Deltaproteobacteria bacterium]